jgi:hypothetical protein
MSGGTLDSTFSLDGKATVLFDGATCVRAGRRRASRRQDRCGWLHDRQRSGLTRFAAARFNVDGTLDTTFGPDHTGKVVSHKPAPAIWTVANAVVIQPDGKIVGGPARRTGFGGDFFIRLRDCPLHARRLAGIAPFDVDGKVTFRVKGDSDALDVALQRDGKIVLPERLQRRADRRKR